jgi:hypothetical protein
MDAVTFRLAWRRTIEGARPSASEEQPIELTLHPGQTLPIDVQAFAPHPMRSCGINQAVLTVSVQGPPRELDRQLVLTDLWLIDRAADGSERTQRLTMRGRYGETQPFFFDDIAAGDRALDLFGEVIVVAREDGVNLQITTTRRLAASGRSNDHANATSILHLRPTDTAAVELPRSAGPFEGHQLSLRIQSREIRPASGPQANKN